jgi:hypothetical protein
LGRGEERGGIQLLQRGLQQLPRGWARQPLAQGTVEKHVSTARWRRGAPRAAVGDDEPGTRLSRGSLHFLAAQSLTPLRERRDRIWLDVLRDIQSSGPGCRRPVIWSSSVTRPASSATYDAGTGDLLWQFATGSGIRGGPITYTVNNKQYVAVPSGWRGWLKGFAPGLYAVREA